MKQLTEQEKFTAWASKNGYDVSVGADGDFMDFETDAAWQGWQARAMEEE